jgi:hypothetical protein
VRTGLASLRVSGATSVRDSVVALGDRCPARAATISPALANRSSGAFARHLMTTASVDAGIPDTRSPSGGAGSLVIAASIARMVLPWNGRVPSSIS